MAHLAARPVSEARSAVTQYIDVPLREAVARLREPLRHMAEYHFGWIDNETTLTAPQERPLRRRAAAITLLSVGGNETSWAPARNVAVANALLWSGLLIHDDLVDGDRVRYGRATVWEAFGVDAAVNLGSAMVALAFQRLEAEPPQTRNELYRRMASCVATTYQGQAAEAAIERDRRVRIQDVLDVYALKTVPGAIYCFSTGPVSVQAPAQRVEAAARLGEDFGFAYQLRNDFTSLWEAPWSQLEDALSDLRQRKLTAVVAYALQHFQQDCPALADLYHGTGSPDTDDLTLIPAELERCGAKAWLEQQIAQRTEAALKWVPRAAPGPAAAAGLDALVRDLCGLSSSEAGTP